MGSEPLTNEEFSRLLDSRLASLAKENVGPGMNPTMQAFGQIRTLEYLKALLLAVGGPELMDQAERNVLEVIDKELTGLEQQVKKMRVQQLFAPPPPQLPPGLRGTH